MNRDGTLEEVATKVRALKGWRAEDPAGRRHSYPSQTELLAWALDRAEAMQAARDEYRDQLEGEVDATVPPVTSGRGMTAPGRPVVDVPTGEAL